MFGVQSLPSVSDEVTPCQAQNAFPDGTSIWQVERKEHQTESGGGLGLILVLSLTSCVTLGKSLPFSEPQVPRLKND